MEWLLWVVALVAAMLLADRLLLRMEARGWIYWRKTPRRPGRGPSPISPIGGVFEPGPIYLAEAQEERTLEAEEAGDGSRKTRRVHIHDVTGPVRVPLQQGGKD